MRTEGFLLAPEPLRAILPPKSEPLIETNAMEAKTERSKRDTRAVSQQSGIQRCSPQRQTWRALPIHPPVQEH